jgi:hypothetical protein
MKELAKAFIFGSVLTLIMLPPLRAQSGTGAPSRSDATTAKAAPTGQAPDDATKKITELVHTGKYEEAQQLTTGLLLVYPNDPRLIKAKVLIEKLLSPAGSANAPSSKQPTGNVPSAKPAFAEQLTGMDKVDYNALIVLARQAQQTTDLDEQKKLLQQFIDQSSAFLQKHPDQMLLWQFRVMSAIGLDEPMEGYEAGQRLLAVGAADSNDPALQQLLAQLKNKGWLDQQGVKEAEQRIEKRKKYDWLIGTWEGTASWFSTAAYDYGERRNRQKVEFIESGSSVEGYTYNINGKRDKTPAFRYTVRNLEEMNLPTNWTTELKLNEWQPISSFAIGSDRRTITIVALGHTFVLMKTSDQQN